VEPPASIATCKLPAGGDTNGQDAICDPALFTCKITTSIYH